MRKLLSIVSLLMAAMAYQGNVGLSSAQASLKEGSETMRENLGSIRANLAAWLTAYNAKDIDALMALYEVESIYAGATAPLLTNLDEIRARYAAGFANNRGKLLFKEEKAFVSGDMGLLLGKYYFQPPKGVNAPGPTGRVTLVYRRQDDGRWKLLLDMDNSPPDVLPSDFE
ncbi:MAG: DUF4440 domain-containing protein [Pseudomonadota bacterium]